MKNENRLWIERERKWEINSDTHENLKFHIQDIVHAQEYIKMKEREQHLTDSCL
jgi:hypothetical protein